MEAVVIILFLILSVVVIDTLTYKAFNDVFKKLSSNLENLADKTFFGLFKKNA